MPGSHGSAGLSGVIMMKTALKTVATCALMLAALPAWAAERIDFSATSSNGAFQTTYVGKLSQQGAASFNDVVSGFLSFDLGAPGVSYSAQKSGSYEQYLYRSASSDFIRYVVNSSGLNPSQSGALEGQISFFTVNQMDFVAQFTGTNTITNTSVISGGTFVSKLVSNTFILTLSGAGSFVANADGRKLLMFSASPNASYAAYNNNTVQTFTQSDISTDGFRLESSGKVTQVSSTLISAVPEPATWAMMLVGFGMIGAASRYRRRSVKVSLA